MRRECFKRRKKLICRARKPATKFLVPRVTKKLSHGNSDDNFLNFNVLLLDCCKTLVLNERKYPDFRHFLKLQ